MGTAAKKSPLDGLSDSDILQRAGHLGPGIIGDELFERANEIRKRTVNGTLGPAIVGRAGKPAVVKGGDVDITPWENIPRNQCLKIAREAGIACKSNWIHDEVAEALVRAGVAPPQAGD